MFFAILYSSYTLFFCNTSPQLYRTSPLLFAVSPQQHRQGIEDLQIQQMLTKRAGDG